MRVSEEPVCIDLFRQIQFFPPWIWDLPVHVVLPLIIHVAYLQLPLYRFFGTLMLKPVLKIWRIGGSPKIPARTRRQDGPTDTNFDPPLFWLGIHVKTVKSGKLKNSFLFKDKTRWKCFLIYIQYIYNILSDACMRDQNYLRMYVNCLRPRTYFKFLMQV